jgi:uncharacterized membrane protein YphA (DoxX/SURF4 family)
MHALQLIIQIIIPLGIFNVWLVRPRLQTPYRGSNATTLKDEFTAYGLPHWAFYVIGGLKLTAAAMLLLGLIVPVLILPAAGLMAGLMLGAVLMHAKVGDPLTRYVPALLMLCMSLVLCF